MKILIILLPLLLAGQSSALDIRKINGKFNTTVSLPCHKPCSGVVKWIKARPLSQEIAVCKNGNCTINSSLEKRVTPILSGNISLLLQQVVLADEGWYEGHCDITVICDVTLTLLAHQSSVEVHFGVPLIISLLSSEPVRVMFRKSGLNDSADKLVCIVEGAVPFCVGEYGKRASVQSHTLQFADVTQSDVGNFTVTHSETKRTLNTVNVTVKEKDKDDSSCRLSTPCNIIEVVAALILGFFLWPLFWRFIASVKRGYVKISNRVQKKRKRHRSSEPSRAEKNKDITEDLMTSVNI